MHYDGFDTELLVLNGRARIRDLVGTVRGTRREGGRAVRDRRWSADGLLRSDFVIGRGR